MSQAKQLRSTTSGCQDKPLMVWRASKRGELDTYSHTTR